MFNILVSGAIGAALAVVAAFGGVAAIQSSPEPVDGELVIYADE